MLAFEYLFWYNFLCRGLYRDYNFYWKLLDIELYSFGRCMIRKYGFESDQHICHLLNLIINNFNKKKIKN